MTAADTYPTGPAARPIRGIAAPTTIGVMLCVYVAVFLLPIEFSVFLGPVFLTPTRILFLILLFPLIFRLFTQAKLMQVDAVMAAYTLWVVMAHLVKRGGSGLEPAGQAMIEIVVPYLVARLFLKSPAQLRRFYALMVVIIGLLGLLAIPEAVLGVRYLHTIPAQVTGIIYEMQADTRLGLLRAASTFENPILFGLYCATFMALFWFAFEQTGARLIAVAAVILATATSLSSAPILMLLLQIAFIGMERLTRSIKKRTTILLSMITVSVIFLEVSSDRGTAGLIASYLTFNPATGYYRLLQWDFSIDDVMANPMFGIRLEEWTRPFWMTDSIDNHWLLLAMVSGIPAVLLLTYAIVLLIWRLYRRRKASSDPVLRSMIMGWIIGAVVLYLGGWTVALFGKMNPALFFFVGIGAALAAMDSKEAAADGEGTGTQGTTGADDAPLVLNTYSRFGARPNTDALPKTSARPDAAPKTGARPDARQATPANRAAKRHPLRGR